jgi:DNA-binding GntR family transcriptional regulator
MAAEKGQLGATAPQGDTPVPDSLSVTAIHAGLRESILRGEMAPGATTTQVLLARELGVGRNPLREALRILQSEGLVVSEPNHRVRIAGLSGDDAEGLYVMRIAIEVTAIRITVPQLRSPDIAEMEGLLAQHEHYLRTNDRLALRGPHRAFHQRLIGGVHERVSTTIGELFDHAGRYREIYGGSFADLGDVHRTEHRAILDAAAAGDGERAAEQLALHYVRAAVRVFNAIDPQRDSSRLRVALQGLAPGAESALDEAG